MLKLFDNVKAVEFSRNKKNVLGMSDPTGESFGFVTPATIDGPVEVWMETVENEMKTSLHDIMKEGVYKYANMERSVWIEECLGMVDIAGSQIWWTWEVEDVFRKVAGGDK